MSMSIYLLSKRDARATLPMRGVSGVFNDSWSESEFLSSASWWSTVIFRLSSITQLVRSYGKDETKGNQSRTTGRYLKQDSTMFLWLLGLFDCMNDCMKVEDTVWCAPRRSQSFILWVLWSAWLRAQDLLGFAAFPPRRPPRCSYIICSDTQKEISGLIDPWILCITCYNPRSEIVAS